MRTTLDVRIGEVRIARNGELLKAILGSCVGVGAIWKEKRICGLAHCLLPQSPVPTFAIGGRFVDQAMRSLVAMMRIRPENRAEVDLVIVGGGNMTNPGAVDSEGLVGANNFRSALRIAAELGLRVALADGGGEEGRKIWIDGSSFAYGVEKIPRIIGVA